MTSVVAALSVYVEPLASGARVVVLGDASLDLAEVLIEAGARSVHVFDPDPERARRARAPRGVTIRALEGELDIRDAAFDLAIVPDVGALPDAGSMLGRLRRVVDSRGAVVALARARVERDPLLPASFPEIAPAAIEYAELYELFALRFEHVTMAGVLPFAGVVFAELGAADDLAVSVDTRAGEGAAPDVFVVIASREPRELDGYSIVQVPAAAPAPDRGDHAAAYAAMQLRAELLASQVDELRARLAAAETRSGEGSMRFERLALERDEAVLRSADYDALVARGVELEALLVSAQQALSLLERRLLAAEQGMIERDDRIEALTAELRSRVPAEAAPIDPSLVDELARRAERAEAALALHVADLAHVAEAHSSETAALEAQLRERAGIVAALEKEILRREQLVLELVASLEEARAGSSIEGFETAPPLSTGTEDIARLQRKVDELALEIARREGELIAQEWRLAEVTFSAAAQSSASGEAASEGPRERERELERELASARDQLDALRTALTQEHAARVAAERSRGREGTAGPHPPGD
jgi:hypothetical protein